MKLLKHFFCLFAVGCIVIGTSIYTYAAVAHTHNYKVNDKTLYNVKAGASHSYVSGYKTDPITGNMTPVYSTCYTSIYQYRGTFKCTDLIVIRDEETGDIISAAECGATSGFYYYPDETHYSACRQ